MAAWQDRDSELPGWACHGGETRGREVAEAADVRSPFAHDRDRIVHSQAFRRLQHKTQVFVVHEGDFFRTRLTHTLEVAQIARSLATTVEANCDLAEAIALGHDLGHTPFGHAGERHLDKLLKNRGDDFGFDHNIQSFRVARKLENRYADKRGLNLTWETQEGLIRHSTRYDQAAPILAYQEFFEDPQPSIEAQLCNVADDIAYSAHDLDDGVAAGFVRWGDLLGYLDEKLDRPCRLREEYDAAVARVDGDAHDSQHQQARLIRKETVRGLLYWAITDAEVNTTTQIQNAGVDSVDKVRHLAEPLATNSADVASELGYIKDYLMEHMYRDFRVMRMDQKGCRILTSLFEAFSEKSGRSLMHPLTLWHYRKAEQAGKSVERVIVDYITGMTDRHAMDLYAQLFSTREKTITADD